MQVSVRSTASPVLPVAPDFMSSLTHDVAIASRYFGAIEDIVASFGCAEERDSAARKEVTAIRRQARVAKEAFFRRHAAKMYEELTGAYAIPLRLSELVYSASDRYPGLLPTRKDIERERALQRQFAKDGHEIDQGLFVAHVLANEASGMHLIHAMLKPKRESESRISEFKRTGFVDLGSATVQRRGNIGEVTLNNPKFLNAEDDAAVAALETAVDLVLLDEQIQVGVLRGSVLQHPKYPGRRVFNSGINLTHLYYGRISFIEFILERELGLLNKIYRGHWRSSSYDEQFEDFVEKPWLAVVDSFAIGGGCQLLCVMDRVIAEPGAYFNLPASKEGFIPGSANLRLPRLVGIHLARQGIFFEKPFPVDTPEGMTICDEVVPSDQMDQAIARNTAQMIRAGFTSTVSNRKALRVGQEPLPVYRRYMATYSRQQCLCFYDQDLIDNLERMWEPEKRRL